MRPLSVILILSLAAVVVFLVYGGRAAIPSAPSHETERIVPTDAGAPSAADMRAEIDALSKRIDALTDEVARMRQSSERVTVPAASAPQPKDDLGPEQRQAVLHLIAEDRDQQVLKQNAPSLRLALGEFLVVDRTDPMHWRVVAPPDPRAFPMDDVMATLIDARLRYGELCRRLVPSDRRPEDDGPWKAGFTNEVTRLREWRRAELVRLAGAANADKIGEHAQRILGF